MMKLICLGFSLLMFSAPTMAETTAKPKQRQKVVPIEESGYATQSENTVPDYGSPSSYQMSRTSRAQLGFELLGPGLIYSVGGSFLFTDNFAINAGISHFSVSGSSTTSTSRVDTKVSLTTIPLSLSFLLGGPEHHFDAYAGVTPLIASGEVREEDNPADKATGKGSYLFLGGGYRYWPVNGGFHFRASLSGLIIGGDFFVWPGFQFGYAF